MTQTTEQPICRICERPLPDTSNICPSCGYEHVGNNKLKVLVVLSLVVIIFAIIIYFSVTAQVVDILGEDSHIVEHDIEHDTKHSIENNTEHGIGHEIKE